MKHVGVRSNAKDVVSQEQLVFREKLTAARTYYVRTDGSDSNTGLVDSAGGAFLTVQKGIDTLCSLDLSLYDCTVQIGPGTRTAALTLKKYVTGGGVAILLGDTATPSNVVMSVTSNNCFAGVECGLWRITGMKLQTTTSGYAVFPSGKTSNVELRNIDFGACASGHVVVGAGGFARYSANCTISGGAPTHLQIANGSSFVAGGITITLTGTPAFTTFASLDSLALAAIQSVTFSGSATGARYSVTLNSVLNTFGAGATFLPGNSAGSTATGGQYA
ncbi:hypothetical protein [Acidovorax sp. Leaf73]|uniref:hypothetical protein n=1 Tax=Acidovorax sp. Leaf73 TaxID=2876566 RepID=UPI001E37B863|nr:hypothetical protein [Acidovorax sp. Leaf73]